MIGAGLHVGFSDETQGVETRFNHCSGDLVTKLIMGIIEVTIWVIRLINLLTKSP